MTREELFKNAMMLGDKIDTGEIFRQTGRTERMLQDAIQTAKKGRPVLILAKDDMMAKVLRQRIGGAAGIDVQNATMPSIRKEIDWDRLTIGGMYANHVVFFDHDTLYCQFKEVLRAFWKYDPKIEVKGDTMRFITDSEREANKTRLDRLMEKLIEQCGSEKAAMKYYRGLFSNETGGFTAETLEKVFQDHGITA